MQNIEYEVKTFLKKYLNNNLKAKLVIALSGGLDSLTLTFLLKRLGLNIIAVHFNHKVRLASDDEAEFVRLFCKKNKIPYYYYTVNLPQEGNFQSEARIFRYKKLRQVARQNNTQYILTGHHLDDLVETVLIKITRGSNLRGYSGISECYMEDGFYYLRPFLNYTKDEIKTYAKDHKLIFCEDQSNYSHKYLRNRYRLCIVPVMKQENDTFLTQVKQYSTQLKEAYDFMREQTISFLQAQNDKIQISAYHALNEAIKSDLISYLLEQNKINITFNLIMQIKELLANPKPNLELALSNNFYFIKAYDYFYLIKKPRQFKRVVTTIKENSKQVITYTFTNQNYSKPNGKISYNENDIKWPLKMRQRQDGDELAFHYGQKKLSRFLIDKKIPIDLRDKLLIVVDSNNQILWIPNYYLNQTLKGDKMVYFKASEDVNNDAA